VRDILFIYALAMANRIDYGLIDKAAELMRDAVYDLDEQLAKDEPSRDAVVQDAKICLSLSEIVLRELGETAPRAFDARARIEAMRDRPEMWADTREGFVLQLALLLELAGLKARKGTRRGRVRSPHRRGALARAADRRVER
jgi:hypothetical protein